MSLNSRRFVLFMIIIAANIILAFIPISASIVRMIFVLPLVFVLPGYALSDVLFIRRSLGVSERLLFSLGLSLAVDILAGFLLNALPVGLQTTSWAVLLGLLTLVFSLLAVYLKIGVPTVRIRLLKIHLPVYPGILFVLAITIVIMSIVYAIYGTSHQQYPGFTQLWILPQASTDNSCAVSVGIQSFEATPVTYHLTMAANGDLVATWSSLSLTPHEKWVRIVPILPSASNDTSIDVRLYQAQKPETVYREVHLTFSSVRDGKNGETHLCGTL